MGVVSGRERISGSDPSPIGRAEVFANSPTEISPGISMGTRAQPLVKKENKPHKIFRESEKREGRSPSIRGSDSCFGSATNKLYKADQVRYHLHLTWTCLLLGSRRGQELSLRRPLVFNLCN